MTIQYVNTGSGANAGDGDSLRTAFYKINNNFAELSASSTDSSVIIVNAFPPTTSTEGTIWYDTVSGRNFIYYDGFWVDAAPPVADPVDLTTVTSHILPGADLTYDLGSTSSQWRSLYVGSSTIYLGGTPLSIVDGRLTVNGIDSATTSSLRNNGSSLSIDSTGTTLFLPSGNSVIRSFNNISQEGYNNSIIELIPDFQLIYATTASDYHQYIVIDPNSAENHVHIRTGGERDRSNAALWLGGKYNHVKISDIENGVTIGSNDGNEIIGEWKFTYDRKFVLPRQSLIPGIAIDILADSPGDHIIENAEDWKLIIKAGATRSNDGKLELGAGQSTKILINGDSSSIDFIASDEINVNTWTMNVDGELVFPDGSIQNTAYTSTNFDQNLNTTDSPTFNNIDLTGSNGLAILNSTATELSISSDGTLVIKTNYTSKSWTFGIDGGITFPDSTVQTTAYKTGAGSWSLEPGANTVSFTVSQNTSYTMWVRGNIPNGIVVWNATVSLSNSNVPAIGNQYGWYYAEGNNLVLDSIPNQIIGTVGTISSATVVTTNSNVFSFGITNNSSSTQVVNWGYVRI
jgi:hypothetical protein